MAKKEARRVGRAKKNTSLAKRNKPKNSQVLATTTKNGKEVNIERWHIAGISISPVGIVFSGDLGRKAKAHLQLKFEAVGAALRSGSKDLEDETINTILGDLVAGAYQDKMLTYAVTPTRNTTEALERVQRLRQSADMHLLNMVKAVRDIRRPPVSVFVKEAEQVNVAEQLNQADKQVNIAGRK